jgi:hypothetical protein
MCQSLSLLGSVVPWKTLLTRVQAPTSIGGSTSGRVAGMASVAVGGFFSASTAGGVADAGAAGATTAGGAPGGGASTGGGSASAGVAQSNAPNIAPVANFVHREPPVPSFIFFLVS